MTRTERRALLIAPILPSTAGNGLAIRLAMFADALARIAHTDVLCVPVFGQAGDASWLRQRGIEATIIDPGGREETAYRLGLLESDPKRRLAAFRRYGRSRLEAKLSLPVLNELRQHIDTRRYELIHIARGYLMRAAMSAFGASKLTVDLDEDDAWSWRSSMRLHDPDAAGWLRADAAAADRSLSELWQSFDTVFISGRADGRRLSRRHKGLQPIAVANPAPDVAASRSDDGRTLLFVGSFGYQPNLDGMIWFIDRMWPLVTAARPATRLRIIGRDLPNQLLNLHGQHNIEALGAVDDLTPAYATATLAIAPLRAGGGTRIKLIEAAAFGVPIVSTSLGARGLSFGSPRGMWLADSAEVFAEAILEALDSPGEQAGRAAYALRMVAKHHARDALVDELACRFDTLWNR